MGRRRGQHLGTRSSGKTVNYTPLCLFLLRSLPDCRTRTTMAQGSRQTPPHVLRGRARHTPRWLCVLLPSAYRGDTTTIF